MAAGHGCVGCSEPGFWDTMSPFYDRLPHVATRDFSLTADRIGLGVLAATATGFAAHGAGKVIQHRVAASHATTDIQDIQDAAEPAGPADDRGGQAT